MIRAVIFDMYETLITHYRCPLYFSAEMAADAGLPAADFQRLWRATEEARTTGLLTLEDALTDILRACGRRDPDRVDAIVRRRVATKEACFRHLHEGVLPMLSALKAQGMLVGLISNCFSEEAAVIRESALYPFFDAPLLSWEEGLQKPDAAIFRRCMERLGVSPEECLYVGDGGSHELETARRLGMEALQAAWYLREDTMQPVGRMPEFPQLEHPMEVLEHLA
ncbi:MAG: HAD family hydrolase [Aristaeellaceae bacterium]